MTDRRSVWDAIGAQIKPWTIDDKGLSVNGPEDQDHFNQMMVYPEVRSAVADRIRGRASPPDNEVARLMAAHIAELLAEPSAITPIPPVSPSSAPNPMPPAPLRMSDAVQRYKNSKEAINEHGKRTARDKERLLERLAAFVAKTYPQLGADPYVHNIERHHIAAFLDAASVKQATDGTETGTAAAPRTALKKISDLSSFFQWAHNEYQATLVDPTDALGRRSKALRKAASKEERHYGLFTDTHLARIFEPTNFLSFNNAADYFWAPLLSLHMGARLKEIVTLKLVNIRQHAGTGLWYVDVTSENAKNKNSIRRIPLPDKIIELGFIDYVECLRRLGAHALFPHQKMDSKTFLNDPSKNCSRKFGKYLDSDAVGIVDPELVFHSFRHTVITRLIKSGTQLVHSMQLVGHQAQEYAIKMGDGNSREAQSVHLKSYFHPDAIDDDVDYPLATLKDVLDEKLRFPLKYEQLKKAATVVTNNVKKSRRAPHRFTSGWSKLRKTYAAKQLSVLT